MKALKYVFFSIIIAFTLLLVYFVTYTFAEPKAYDFMTKNALLRNWIGSEQHPLYVDTRKNVYGHGDIILVVIDAKTNERYRWPWKRELNCKIFNYFTEYAKPKIIVHDSIITTLDPENPESDKKYFDTMNGIDNLVAGAFFTGLTYTDKKFGEEYDKEFIKKFAYPAEVQGTKLPRSIYNSILPFPKQYFDVIKQVGSVIVVPGAINGDLIHSLDEVYRTQEYLINYNNSIMPSLAMRTFLSANDNPKIIINKNYTEIPALNYKIKHRITDYQVIIPTRYYKLWGDYSHPMLSALDIMDSYDAMKTGKKPIIDPEIFKDKIVIIGANVPASTSLNDNKNTPVAPQHPGIDIQATAIDNLIHNDFLTVLPQYVNILITILGMFLIYWITKCNDIIKGISSSIGLIVLYFIIAFCCFYYAVVINVITPIVMFVITMIFGFAYKFLVENRNKQKVQNAMGKYMSEDVMKLVLKNIDNLGLGGKKAVVTVLFSDIRGFTSMSEKMSAQQVSEMLNEYFTEMEIIVTKHKGIINKFIGDAVMAVFGEPIQDENHALNAVLCGYEMLQKVEELHSKWQEENKPLINIGVGVNTGDVFVGNIGSINRMEYTVIGDTVNLASRLESYNKTYHTKMLISETTYEASKDKIEVNQIPDVEIRGKAQKINIYEVIGVKNS